DCVELMIDPTGDGKNYFEIQVSPRGVVFDTRYDSPRFPAPFGHTDWDSNVRVGVSPRGNIDDKEADAGYIVEMAIPWQAFSLDGKRVSPPAIGDEWRANLYVMDLIADRQQAAAWSPLETGDFHVPRRFGILAFEEDPIEDLCGPHAKADGTSSCARPRCEGYDDSKTSDQPTTPR
ncbi:MAG: carbohydrate-binding family 9-like protein, partial [Deltaproteobacteria bacterium]|nr:carbohydrate-binding family 9-like protein [Deltaproteobacteria bacterium]